MTVMLELANGNTEIFKTENYIIGKVKDFHPMICKISIYDNGKNLSNFGISISHSNLKKFNIN